MAASDKKSKQDTKRANNYKEALENTKEIEHCCICHNETGLKMFSCIQSHLICPICFYKVGERCPFCSPIVPLTKSKRMENLNQDKR